MSSPYLGQIQSFAFNVVPQGWLPCNGQSLPIKTYQALFALLGTMYGGDGMTTFNLPNLQGCFPLGQGSAGGVAYNVGSTGGEATHTLVVAEMPTHTHNLVASSAPPTNSSPAGNFPALSSPAHPQSYANTSNTTLGIGSAGNSGSVAHNNTPPTLAIQFCIAISGVFPQRS